MFIKADQYNKETSKTNYSINLSGVNECGKNVGIAPGKLNTVNEKMANDQGAKGGTLVLT